MKYKSIISQKSEYYNDYIIANNIAHKLFDPSKHSKYDLKTYLDIYFLFQKSGLSYAVFYDIFKYANSLDSDNYPKKSCLHEFKNKLARLDLHRTIHNDHLDEVMTTDLLIDSVNIPNKNNSILANNYNYKGKKCAKITHVVSDIGYPIIPSFDPGNDNDAKIGLKVIKDNISLLKNNNVSMLADKGYDSKNIRDFAYDNGISVIIPQNIRRADNANIKEIKRIEKEKNNNKRKQLMISQKNLRMQLKQKMADRNKIKNKANKTNIKNISLRSLDKIITNITTNIDDIKSERKELQKQLKLNIKNEIIKIDPNNNDDKKCIENMGFRKCAFCDHKKVCNVCEKCKKCKKNLSYYRGLSNDDIIRYKKRIRVEHFISHYKQGRTANLKDKKIKMLVDTTYNRYTDFLFIKNIIK